MLTSFHVFVLLCIVLQCMSEIQLYKNELPEDVKILAIGTAEREILVLKHNDSVVAQTLSDDFSNVYGGKWTCFVGLKGFIEGILPVINTAPNTTLWFAYNTTHVLLFKSQQCEATQSNDYKDVINGALDYSITYVHTNYNNTMQESIVTIIKDAIKAESGVNCTTHATTNWADSRNCYYQLAININSKLNAMYKASWTILAGKLNSAMIWNPTYRTNYYQAIFNNTFDISLFDK